MMLVSTLIGAEKKATRNKTQQNMLEKQGITVAAHSVSIEPIFKSVGAVKDISLYIARVLLYNLTGIALTAGVLYALSCFLLNCIAASAATALNRVREIINHVQLNIHTL